MNIKSLPSQFPYDEWKRWNLNAKNAEWYLNLESLPGERPISQKRVDRLKKAMKTGTFRGESQAIVTVRIGRGTTKFKINGQHTCWAYIDEKDLPSFTTNYIHYHVKTKEEAADLYATFDPTESARTPAHNFRIYQKAVGLKDRDMRVLGLVSTAVLFDLAEQDFRASRLFDQDTKKKIPIEYREFTDFMCGLLFSHKDHRHLFRMPVACAIYQGYTISLKMASGFWMAVRDGENLKQGDARKLLENYLRQITMLKGDQKPKDGEIYAKCAHAWNAFLSGDNTTLRYYKNKPLPKFRGGDGKRTNGGKKRK